VENHNAVIEYRPLGPILAVMPWNFPLWQVLRGAVPILLAGNSYLLKHAPNVLGSADLIAQIFADAGFPEGVFGWVNATNDGVSQAINDRRIAAVTVTGSVRAGAAIGAQAGAALKNACWSWAVPTRLSSSTMPTWICREGGGGGSLPEYRAGVRGGQTLHRRRGYCRDLYPAFCRAVAALKMGAPDREEDYIGPMARFDLRDELHQQVQATLAEGATLLLGGEKISGEGNYYAPTVLANVTPR
jgi:succinate-semialdehyde dehydrogenase